MNLANALERSASDYPQRIALQLGDDGVSYTELLDTARRFAGYLDAAGLRPGEPVAIWSPTALEYLPAVYGVWCAGGVAVPLNYMFGADALRHAVTDSEARWVLCADADVPRLQETLAGLPVSDQVMGWSEFRAHCRTATPRAEIEPRFDGDDALLMYTSGSTGKPKGVRQTHRGAAAQVDGVIDIWRIGPDDHLLNALPLFHVGGLQAFSLPSLARGARLTFQTRWDAVEWLRLVDTLRPTLSGLISTMLIDVSNHVAHSPVRLDSLRACFFGGSRTPPAPVERFRRGTGVQPIEIYGQTEQNGLAVTYRVGEPIREGAMGRALRQILQWQLVAPGTGEIVPPGSEDTGELWVRGDAVTPGYWKLPEANAERFTADGWFRTGDLVRADDDGYLYYVDRIDDMIITGGENVYPQMVEAHLASCPLIAEVAIIGTAHERWVQQVTAIVVPSKPDVSVADILNYCDGDPNLRGLQQPKRIEFVDALPRTGSGKLNRPELKAMFH